jgi:D-serine deaminase-like pyridoxal phosphate-dependent protein
VTTNMDALHTSVEAERRQPLDWRDKAVQPAWYGRSTADVAAERHLLDQLSTPVATLDRAATNHNVATMAAWCEKGQVSLAPHGKTTMAPALWLDQLRAGAWAITVANEPQLRVARGVGVPRVVLANLFLRPSGLAWLAAERDADPDFEFLCWVDSVDAVRLMDDALVAAGARRPVSVLVEVGSPGARTGARSVNHALDVAAAVVSAPSLALAGVAGYEGVVAHGAGREALALVDGFLLQMVDLHRRLLARYEVAEPVLSAGGSAYFDRVVAVLGSERGGHNGGPRTRVVVRSGAYVTHDDGNYREMTPSVRDSGPVFRPALHVWSRVISMPEPGIAYLDAGKRDLPFDEGLPEVQLFRRRERDGSVTSRALSRHELFDTNDQHSHVRVPAESPLAVGDVVRLGISHPCTAFDKWSLIPILDDATSASPVVVDLLRTHF